MKSRYTSIPELIRNLESERERINNYISALSSALVSFEDEVIFKYIKTRSTVKTAAFVKLKDIKSPKGTVYAANYVSEIIKNSNSQVNPVLLLIARDIFNKNTKAVIHAYG